MHTPEMEMPLRSLEKQKESKEIHSFVVLVSECWKLKLAFFMQQVTPVVPYISL
jgi:hypothetical protein